MENLTKPINWQHPFVDVFKNFQTFKSSSQAKKGKVYDQQDNSIGRKIFKIQGSILASNYVQIPDPQTNIKKLELTGRYIYLALLIQKGKQFSLHLDFNIIDSDVTVRFSLSNTFDKYSITGTVLKVPMPKCSEDKWGIHVLDVEHLLENNNLFPSKQLKSFKGLHSLRSIQICSNVLIRGIYTSDILYTPNNLPKEMNYKIQKQEKWEDLYQYIGYPTDIENFNEQKGAQQENNKENKLPPNSQKQQQKSQSPAKRQQQSRPQQAATSTKKQNLKTTSQSPPQKQTIEQEQQLQNEQQQQLQQDAVQQVQDINLNSQQKQFQQTSNFRQTSSGQKSYQQPQFRTANFSNNIRNKFISTAHKNQQIFSEQNENNYLTPDQIVQLEYTLGFSGKYCPDIKWATDHSSELLFASGSLLVGHNVNQKKQRYFFGHNKPICCLDLSSDGQFIVTAQTGSSSVVKIWDYNDGICIYSFHAPYESIKCLAFSKNRKQLCTVGVDEKNREVIIIWNIEKILERQDENQNLHALEIIAKQQSDFNILSIKFSPIENDKLVSCGKENIRFWRIKKFNDVQTGHLPGFAVVLKHNARNTVFTVLDFEFSHNDQFTAQLDQLARVYVGSKNGLLFQVNYNTRLLERVIKLHDSSICSISISSTWCVTGSEDQYLRIWPLDFSDFISESQHQGVVISLDISPDALQIACGSSNGGLGVMDLSNLSYKTILRSHIDEIVDMKIQKLTNSLITLSKDFTIRIWDLEKFDQQYEFYYPLQDQCLCIDAHPTENLFVAGFSSGTFRIFDIETACLKEEARYHQGQIKCLAFSPNGRFLVVGDSNCFYCIYDTTRNYQPIKTLDYEYPSEFQSISFSTNSQIFVTIGESGSHLNFWDTKHFQNILKIFTQNVFIKNIQFSQNNQEVFVITTDSRVRVYAIRQVSAQDAESHQPPALTCEYEGFFLRELSCVHRNALNQLTLSNNLNYMVTVGADCFLKVWNYNFQLVGPAGGQLFLMHVNSVNQVLFSPNNEFIYTAGGFEGIYVWRFLGNTGEDQKQLNFNEASAVSKKKTDFSKNYSKSKLREFQQQQQQQISGLQQQQEPDYEVDEQQPNQQQHLVIEDVEAEEAQQSKQLTSSQKQQLFEEKDQENLKISGLTEQRKDQLQIELQSPGGGKEKSFLNVSKGQPSPKNISKLLSPYVQPSKFRNDQQKQLLNLTQNVKPVTLIQEFEQVFIQYKKSRQRKSSKHQQVYHYVKDSVREQFGLPYKHLFHESTNAIKFKNNIDKIFIRNQDQLQLQYINAFNNNSHNNVVWNYVLGWFAYTVENMLIIEELNKERKQKVITIPDFISVILLSKDGNKLVLGSSCVNQNSIANIYILDCTTFIILKTLSFHTKGVQQLSFAKDYKFLISVGNFRESTVAVWEFATGKLLASSYTLDKINDIKVSENTYANNRIFEFCTVGRDQFQFWAFTRDQRLEYYDVFIEKKEDKIEELTSIAFIKQGDAEFVLGGTATGDLVIINYHTFKIVVKKTVTDQEIIDIQASNFNNRVLISTLDAHIYYSTIEQLDEFNLQNLHFYKLKLPSPAIAISFDPILNEGLVGCLNSGLYYVNLNEKYASNIVGTIDQRQDYRLQYINEEIFATIHNDGKFKLWNVETGEEVFCYQFKSVISCVLYTQSLTEQKLTCFFQNNNEITYLNLKKLGQIETYMHDELQASQKQAEDYPVKFLLMKLENNVKQFILIMKKGNVFVIESHQSGSSKLQTVFQNKITEIPDAPITDVIQLEKTLLAIATDNGKVGVYNVSQQKNQGEENYIFSFLTTDSYDLFDDPHGQKVDQNQENLLVTQSLYKDQKTNVKLATTRNMEGFYFCISDVLQYVFVRNYQRKTVVKRIPLESFPLYISICFNQNYQKAFIGLENGVIAVLDLDKYNVVQYQSFLNSKVNEVINFKKKDKIVVTNKNGLSCFNLMFQNQ